MADSILGGLTCSSIPSLLEHSAIYFHTDPLYKGCKNPGYAIRVHYGRALVRAFYLYGFKAIYAFTGRQSHYCVIHLCIT